MNEVFDINKVKQEFLQNTGPEYATIFSERQLEMCVYLLNDFCAAMAANNLVLLRVEQEQLMPPQYQQPPIPQMTAPPEYRQPQYQPQPRQQQYQQQYQQPPQYMQDPFQELPLQPIPQQPPQQNVQRQVQELNAQLPKAPQRQFIPPTGAPTPSVQDVDLSADKPKTFAEKIREMRAGAKKPNRINPEDDN